MIFDVAFTAEADSDAKKHLLRHYQRGKLQEDLCFALWRPSTGRARHGALIDEIILPKRGECELHGNASFAPGYISRAIKIAREKKAGIAFMHSHPYPGWQGMSVPDIEAERDVLAYPAGATGLPLVGMTIGTDGYWSARFWEKDGKQMRRHWCEKVRVIGAKSYTVYYNDEIAPPPPRKEILRRTFDTWGRKAQENISRLRIGIVGLGSVGCIVAEAVARIGVGRVTLIDPDKVEEHNLDRLLYSATEDIGKAKVNLAAQAMRRNSTAQKIEIGVYPISIRDESAYRAALDCDILFSCVDRPLARDVLNYIANAHLIPVIDGGVAVEVDNKGERLQSAHWRAHIVTPCHRCLRCNEQYNSSMVAVELDGSLDNPSYVENLPPDKRDGNQNVFPFALGIAGMEINLMLRYLLSLDWWPLVRQQEYQFLTGGTRIINEECYPNCSFRHRRAQGDAENPPYLTPTERVVKTAVVAQPKSVSRVIWQRLVKRFGTLFSSR